MIRSCAAFMRMPSAGQRMTSIPGWKNTSDPENAEMAFSFSAEVFGFCNRKEICPGAGGAGDQLRWGAARHLRRGL